MSKTKDAMMEFTNGFHHSDSIWPGCGWRKPVIKKIKECVAGVKGIACRGYAYPNPPNCEFCKFYK